VGALGRRASLSSPARIVRRSDATVSVPSTALVFIVALGVVALASSFFFVPSRSGRARAKQTAELRPLEVAMLSLQEDVRTELETVELTPGMEAAAMERQGAPLGAIRERVFFAFLFAGVEDGLVAASTTWRTHVGILKTLLAGLEASSFLAFPLAVVAIPLGFLLSREGPRLLGRHVRIGLSGERPEYEGVATVLYAIVFSAGVGLAWGAGFRASDFQSARVATLVSTLAAVVLLFGGATLVSAVALPVGALLERAAKRVRLRIPVWLPLESVLIAAVGVGTLYVLLPPSHAITPAAAIVGFALGPQAAQRIGPLGRSSRASVLVIAPVALALSVAAGVALKHLSDVVQMGVLARAPYASILITTLRRAVDKDHDGYSPILGGGDCNDSDATVHPNAIDVPGDGVDQNCSGTDSRKYAPPVQALGRDTSAAPSRDNVILIHIDALRPDHVGFTGYRRPTTPHIDRWREGATWFKNAYSPAPSTRFALSAIFTGLEVERIPQERGHAVDFTLLPQAVTLAERLATIGYDRVGYTLSYVIQHIHDLGQGFRLWETPWPLDDWKASYQNSAQQTTDAALKYLAKTPADGTTPYFLFLHYECTHDPYIKHSSWDYGDSEVDKYDSALNYCDDQLGRLFDALEARSDKGKTAVFLYSDHGELFGEHGFTKHGNTLYEPDVRTLLVAKVPGATVKTIDTPMLLTDMTPTIYELTGLPPDRQCEEWDLLPYLEGAPLPPRPLYLYSDLWRSGVHFESRGVLDVDGKTMFIRDVSAGMNQLYDLDADPEELSNVADAHPAQRDKLSEMVDGWEAYENKDNRSFETVNKEGREGRDAREVREKREALR
jgi:arylsulfatase A-like enzyme